MLSPVQSRNPLLTLSSHLVTALCLLSMVVLVSADKKAAPTTFETLLRSHNGGNRRQPLVATTPKPR